MMLLLRCLVLLVVPSSFTLALSAPGGKGFGNHSFASSILPAGTLVKHGTTSDVLSSILSKGILPSGSVSAGMMCDRYENGPLLVAFMLPTLMPPIVQHWFPLPAKWP
jgi:hypothetical protein